LPEINEFSAYLPAKGKFNNTSHERREIFEKIANNVPSCVTAFPFMAIESETGLNEGIDGILGLGPNAENGPNYLFALKYYDKIKDTVISFSLGYDN